METRVLYQTDAYLKNFSATVTSVDGSKVALDATVFYPGGGGQPYDLGFLSGGGKTWPVLKVGRTGSTIWHEVEGEPPQVGSVIQGELDWDRRYSLMRTHTALHILCGVVWRDYGAKVTGGKMKPLSGRMDFEFETLRSELIHEIEEKINIEARASRSVRVSFLPRDEADRHPDLIRTKINLLPPGISVIRVVHIGGLDMQADGGTHVANTREVGRIRIVDYKSKGRINKRIRIAVGD